MKRGRTVDDYLENAGRWQAELGRLRRILEETELEETMKWGAPCYTFGGRNVVGLAGFKSYFGLWFHQGALLKDEEGVLINAQEGKTRGLRQWRFTSGDDIRPRIIKRYVKEAVRLARDGRKIAPPTPKPLVLPPELRAALGRSRLAEKKFRELTPGRQRDYAEYIASARREQTKRDRIERIMPMIRQGVGLNDKYRC